MVKRTKKTITQKHPASVSYHEGLIERLKDRKYAIVYLNTAFKESLKGDEESQRIFLKALRNVAEAQGNMSTLAKRAGLSAARLKQMLSADTNPYLQSFPALIHAMGMEIRLY
jgi:DNA-binding phage protein